MPTNNRRVATYIPKEIDSKFQAFKEEKQVGDSQALILILSSYFEVSQKTAYLSESPLFKQVQILESKFDSMSSLLSELKNELSGKAGIDRLSELKSSLLYELKTDSRSILESELPSSLTNISSNSNDSEVAVLSISSTTLDSLDNHESGYELSSESIKSGETIFQKEDTIPLSARGLERAPIQGEILSPVVRNEDGLTGRQLASRLGVSAPCLSKRRSDLTANDFTNWTVSLPNNPDRMGWTYKAREQGKGVLYYPALKQDFDSCTETSSEMESDREEVRGQPINENTVPEKAVDSVPSTEGEDTVLDLQSVTSGVRFDNIPKTSIQGSLLGDLPVSLTLSAKNLALRLGLSNHRNLYGIKSAQKFLRWSQSKDPDRIAWKSTQSNGKYHYSPANDTSPSDLEKLQKWIEKNVRT